jgi:hypothetical protein
MERNPFQENPYESPVIIADLADPPKPPRQPWLDDEWLIILGVIVASLTGILILSPLLSG